MEALKTYLCTARHEGNHPDLRFLIFGNTSADMDSVVGSILMSYYYGLKTGNKYIPVI